MNKIAAQALRRNSGRKLVARGFGDAPRTLISKGFPTTGPRNAPKSAAAPSNPPTPTAMLRLGPASTTARTTVGPAPGTAKPGNGPGKGRGFPTAILAAEAVKPEDGGNPAWGKL